MTRQMVRASVMEGLYVHGVPPSEALTARLEGCGFHARKMEPEYPAEVFNACLDAARTLLFPGLAPAAGFHELGALQVKGLRSTLVGTVLLSGAQLLSPERMMRQVPRLFRVDSTPCVISVHEERPGVWVASFREDPTMNCDYIAGIVRALVAATGKVTPQAQATRLNASDFDVHVSWPVK